MICNFLIDWEQKFTIKFPNYTSLGKSSDNISMK